MIPRIIRKTVDMTKIQKVDRLDGPLYQLEESGHTFVITINGAEGELSGTVSARFLRPDEVTEYFTGTLSGNVVSITLPQQCYLVSGRFGMVVFITGNEVSSAIYAVSGNVYRSTSDAVSDPTGVIPSLDDLIARFDDMQDAINDCEAAAAVANSASAFMPKYLRASNSGNYELYDQFNNDNKRLVAINTSGVVESGENLKNTSYVFSIINFDSVTITAHNNGSFFNFLTSNTLTPGEAAPLSDGTSQYSISGGQTRTYAVPSDAKYMCVSLRNASGVVMTPSNLYGTFKTAARITALEENSATVSEVETYLGL